jgi:hypothetical protein
MITFHIGPYQPLPGHYSLWLPPHGELYNEIVGSGMIDLSQAPKQVPKTALYATRQAILFPGWIKVSVFCSIVALILAFLLSIIYYAGVKFLMVPAFILLLVGLVMFAIGMSAAKHYDTKSQQII